jgi:hypothetical protein
MIDDAEGSARTYSRTQLGQFMAPEVMAFWSIHATL